MFTQGLKIHHKEEFQGGGQVRCGGRAVGRMGWASKYSLVFVTIKGGIQEIPFICTYKWGYVCIFSEVLGDFFLLVLQKMAGT